MNIQIATMDGEQIQLSEKDFFSMLNQNMIQVVSDVDGQVIDNQQLISMLGGLDGVPGASSEGTLPGQWMQFLKSHFSEQSDTDQPLELVISEDKQDEEDVILLQAELTQPEDGREAIVVAPVVPAQQLKGEALPPERQTLTTSAIKPTQLATQDDRVSLTDKVVDASAEALDADNKKLNTAEDQSRDTRAKTPHEFANVRQQIGAAEAVSNKPVDTSVTASQPLNSPVQGAASTTNAAAQQVLPPHLQAISVSNSANNQQWGDALGERVSFLINQKLNSAEIRIDPPHLGKLDIQIHIKDDTAQVVIHTQHAQTRDLVENSSLRLREILQDAGYSSVDVNVSHRDSSSQQQATAEGSVNTDPFHSSDSTGLVDGVMQQVSMHVADGSIDYFA